MVRLREFNEIIAHMGNWIRYVNVTNNINEQHEHVYAFTLETDFAPGLMGEETLAHNDQITDIETRYLDVTNLLNHLQRLLNNNKHSNKIKLSRTLSISLYWL